MDHKQGTRIRYFMLSFCAAFFFISLMFLFLMTTVHPASSQNVSVPEASEVEAYIPDAQDALTVLLFGTESTDAVAGTYILARFDPAGGGVKVAVLPPQTLIPSADGGETLEEAYRYGGAKYTRDALAAYLNLPIDRYARLSLSGFLTAAQTVGNVEFELKEELELPDGELSIQLYPGRQLLDGQKAAALIRSRDYTGGELQRCQIIAQLACAVIDQRIDVVSSVLLDKVFETIINLVDTDISYKDYEERKAPAQLLAEGPRPIAHTVEVEGTFSASGVEFTLSDTALASLNRSFL